MQCSDLLFSLPNMLLIRLCDYYIKNFIQNYFSCFLCFGQSTILSIYIGKELSFFMDICVFPVSYRMEMELSMKSCQTAGNVLSATMRVKQGK